MRNEPAGIRNRRLAALLLALTVALPGSATAQAGGEEARDERERWVPAVSLFGGFLTQKQSGSVTSGDILGPRYDVQNQSTEAKIRPDADGETALVAPVIGGSLELMTPRFFQAVASPRAFAHVDLAAAFSTDLSLAVDQKPEQMRVPPLAGSVNNIPEAAIAGQGSRTISRLQPFVLSAGIGVAFSVELWERRIRIKPSFEYLREEIEVSGLVNRAVKLVPIAPPDEGLDSFRLITLSGSQKQAYHGIGPGLEVEVDAARAGPFMLTVYLAGQGYNFLGDRSVDFEDTNEYGETAAWSFEKEAWGWSMDVGLRFRWLPE
jgi:hypothetical protein